MQPPPVEEIHAAVDRAVALENQGLVENAREQYVRLLAELEPHALADSTDKKTRSAIARASACYAILLEELRDFRAALEAAEWSLRVYETSLIWLFVGQCHHSLKDRASARRAYRKSTELKPRAEAWVLLFSVSDGKEERRACLEKALELDPNYDEAHYNLGVTYRLAGELTLARHHLELAVALDPNYALAHAELGWTLVGSARSARGDEQARALRNSAVMHLELALSLEPTLYWANLYLALALEGLDRPRGAKIQYEAAIRRHPNESLAHAFYGDFLGNRYGNIPLAEHHLRRAVALDPEEPSAHLCLGKFLKKRGNHAEARRHLRRADELGSGAARAVLEEDLIE